MKYKVLLNVLLLALIVAPVAGWSTSPASAQWGAHRLFLPIVRTPGAAPVTPPPVPPRDEATNRLTVPSGFAIRIFASGLSAPRLMAIGPDGQLYVAERGSGEVTRLPDANRDGLADANVVVASGLTGPHSVEWHNGSLYVAENDKITRLTDRNGDGDFLDAGERTTITTNIPVGGRHSTRTAHFGPDGKLYVSAGSSCDVCVETDKRRATILRFNPDGSIPTDNPFVNDPDASRRPVWAEGLRNSVDFLWTPGGQLWADHNGSDGLGDNVPPEEIVINIEKGRHYGWPYCYTPTLGATPAGTQEVRDARVALPSGFTCSQVVPARFTDPAHSAPLSMTLGHGTNFPADYRNDLFVAYHGSWNTDDPNNYRDCKVQRVVIENGAPVRSQPFVNGFRTPGQKCADAWGRPAGVVFGPDGVLYISDDKAGRIYRVVYIGR